ncbi:MAG: hypothetical protein AB7G06_04805 [Bdellovibrionales bacterium]
MTHPRLTQEQEDTVFARIDAGEKLLAPLRATTASLKNVSVAADFSGARAMLFVNHNALSERGEQRFIEALRALRQAGAYEALSDLPVFARANGQPTLVGKAWDLALD